VSFDVDELRGTAHTQAVIRSQQLRRDFLCEPLDSADARALRAYWRFIMCPCVDQTSEPSCSLLFAVSQAGSVLAHRRSGKFDITFHMVSFWPSMNRPSSRQRQFIRFALSSTNLNQPF
jgi:hypothetical protein